MTHIPSPTAFAGRVTVVAGAGSGIGTAVAHMMAASGSAVAILDLDLRAAERVAAEIRGGGADAAGI